MSVSRLATHLDLHMVGPENVAPCNTPTGDLPVRNGVAISEELGGRKLLHFLALKTLGTYRAGTQREIFTTPTPYPEEEVIRSLELPGAGYARKHVLVLDPLMLDDIAGPRHVAWGNSFEYILLGGFKASAIASKWEVELW
ncbi:hypothetical protein [Streptomyces lunaelactis]|uniref:hypothetical protein n=1 Tax=Streptomyces lunaelactis TaxID=1535768 RepID=UPI0015851D61|nr:hypothetical protein [Streptomyces lunaelactis]NUK01773.1 hypothetical protein [Streptomyces lunaelactis]NUK14991.1 hypothetical protein [Streptomyces lunaelactis]